MKPTLIPYLLLFAAVTIFTLTFTACGGSDDDDTPDEPMTPTEEPTLEDRTFKVGDVEFQMTAVQGGTFEMGKAKLGGADAKPIHSVTLTSYFIGQTEVTQELWQVVMGSNPSYRKGARLPVESVSWDDCQTFIAKLNELTGEVFRLPTEAEWEYAARGGNKSQGFIYSGSNNIDEVVWYYDNASYKVHEVATKNPNELGIYDMSGNVNEWCSDFYEAYSDGAQTNPTGPEYGSHRVARGGSWAQYDKYSQVGRRAYNLPTTTRYSLGLRLALSK